MPKAVKYYPEGEACEVRRCGDLTAFTTSYLSSPACLEKEKMSEKESTALPPLRGGCILGWDKRGVKEGVFLAIGKGCLFDVLYWILKLL